MVEQERYRRQRAHAEAITEFLRRYRPHLRDGGREARDFERDFHYLLVRHTELAQEPLVRQFSALAALSIYPPLYVSPKAEPDAT